MICTDNDNMSTMVVNDSSDQNNHDNMSTMVVNPSLNSNAYDFSTMIVSDSAVNEGVPAAAMGQDIQMINDAFMQQLMTKLDPELDRKIIGILQRELPSLWNQWITHVKDQIRSDLFNEINQWLTQAGLMAKR